MFPSHDHFDRKYPRYKPSYNFTKVDIRTIAKWLRINCAFDVKQSQDLAREINRLEDKNFDKDRLAKFLNHHRKNADLDLSANMNAYKFPKGMDSQRMEYVMFLNTHGKLIQKEPHEHSISDWKKVFSQLDYDKSEVKLIAESMYYFLKEQRDNSKTKRPLHPL